MSDKATVRSLVDVAGWILDAARGDGLPPARCLSAGPSMVAIQVESREAVHAWAGWRGFEVLPERDLEDRWLIMARGHMYEAPVEVYTVTTMPLLTAVPPAEAVCGCGHAAGRHTTIGCGVYQGLGQSCRCGKSSGLVFREALELEQARS